MMGYPIRKKKKEMMMMMVSVVWVEMGGIRGCGASWKDIHPHNSVYYYQAYGFLLIFYPNNYRPPWPNQNASNGCVRE